MTQSQKVEQAWETPSHDEIPKISKMHVQALETMQGDEVWVQAGMHHVLLQVTGRKSGAIQKVALPTWRDPSGHRIVVASFAGAVAHPAWYVNLRDREANPEVRCTVQNGAYWSVPEILHGEDYTTTWAQLTADRAWYNDYQARTPRRIPLVRLPETRPV
jgi:deazaflavin-dependent oxidoreductase (nitroreductase family)